MKILLNFYENFIQFLGKYHSVFRKISHNFQENTTQFLREFHEITHFLKRISRNF